MCGVLILKPRKVIKVTYSALNTTVQKLRVEGLLNSKIPKLLNRFQPLKRTSRNIPRAPLAQVVSPGFRA